MRKPRSHGEVYNDLDGEVVNVFRVLRDLADAERLAHLLSLTPFARAEFELSYQEPGDPVERARRTLIRSMQGFGATSFKGHRTGFRSRTYTQNGGALGGWVNFPDEISVFCDRLQGVTIEERDAFELIPFHDGPATLFYVDPPYLPETRSAIQGRTYQDGSRAYARELEPADHERLLALLDGVDGMVVLSAYPSDLYRQHLADWYCIERDTIGESACKRRECLWLNPAAEQALHVSPRGLFRENSPCP